MVASLYYSLPIYLISSWSSNPTTSRYIKYTGRYTNEIVNKTPIPHARIPNIAIIPVIKNKPKVKSHFLFPILKLNLTISVSVKVGL